MFNNYRSRERPAFVGHSRIGGTFSENIPEGKWADMVSMTQMMYLFCHRPADHILYLELISYSPYTRLRNQLPLLSRLRTLSRIRPNSVTHANLKHGRTVRWKKGQRGQTKVVLLCVRFAH